MQNQVQLATNLGRGGVSALILSGSSSIIESIDFTLESLKRRERGLREGELAYGIIFDGDNGKAIDEVVIAAYSRNIRIITGHGGSASALALLNYFTRRGFIETQENIRLFGTSGKNETFLNNLLPETKTEYQALCCLRALNKLKAGEEVNIAQLSDIMRPRVVVLAGAPNVGKSSLLNILCGYERVLVSSIAGTTRDAVRDYINIGGYYAHIIDTAGFRAEAGASETEAIKRGREILCSADIILLVFDSSRPVDNDDILALEAAECSSRASIIPVLNKSDLTGNISLAQTFNLENPVNISCATGAGITALMQHIAATLKDTAGDRDELDK